jgi:hypothetical protein
MIQKDKSGRLEPKEEVGISGVRNIRARSTPRTVPSQLYDPRKEPCVVCGYVKHQDIIKKYIISESDRANKFLEATIYFQDKVYTRTCDLQDLNAIFGADLYCHKTCIMNYIKLYERKVAGSTANQPTTEKLEVWYKVIADIEVGLSQG